MEFFGKMKKINKKDSLRIQGFFRVPIYWYPKDSKIVYDVESMKEIFDIRIKELTGK